MPIYHLTTPDSDSEPSSTDAQNLLPPIDLSSSTKLQNVTSDRMGQTDKWLEDMVRLTVTRTEVVKPPLERKNTIDIKRHRIFSTTVEIRPRGPGPSAMAKEERKEKRKSLGVRDILEDPRTSWIASEIFTIANIQAMVQGGSIMDQKGNKDEIQDKMEVLMEECSDDEYKEIESLIGDYFEDVKINGSDCSEDPGV
jgi:hypothetical protein